MVGFGLMFSWLFDLDLVWCKFPVSGSGFWFGLGGVWLWVWWRMLVSCLG